MKKLWMNSSVLSGVAGLVAFNSDAMDTVLIKTPNGPVRINKADFNDDEHKLHKPSVKEQKEAANAQAKEADDETKNDVIESWNPGVIPHGKKFIVVDQMNEGKPVTKIEGIDPKGYESTKEAWDAIMAVKSRNTGAPGTAPLGPQTHASTLNPSGDTGGAHAAGSAGGPAVVAGKAK